MFNNNENQKKYLKEFTVVMRGPSAVIFREGENFLWKDVPTEFGPVNVSYTSRWLKRSEELTVPGHLLIAIRGFGPSLEEVIEPYANAGLVGLPILALTTNAAIGDPEVEVAFESTTGIEERDYFQSYVPPESEILHRGRLINMKSTLPLFEALKTHTGVERLLRATNQYCIALNSWKIGHAIISLAHLWMALEALTIVRLRAELAVRGLKTEEELADSIGVKKDEDKERRKKKLYAVIRKELLLKGDSDCYDNAKEASDGFEHGFMGFDKLHNLSKKVRDRMAVYIRRAIFDLFGLDNIAMTTLLSDSFNEPIGNWQINKYIRGTLVGKSNALAAPDNAYPFIRWRPGLKSYKVERDGKFQILLEDSFTAELSEGISFQQKSFEAW